METQNKYQEALAQIQEYFQEEAACHLPEESITQILQAEEKRIHFAEQQSIPLSRWIGSNTRRYCKDLLRRQQPFFPLYYLLGVCTEASIVLFLCFLLTFLPISGFPVLSALPSAAPGMVLAFFLAKEWDKSYYRRLLGQQKLPHRLCHILIYGISLAAVSVPMLLLWTTIAPALEQITYHSFLLYVALLFLSGIHNVLYSSHFITFFSIGAFKLSKRPSAVLNAAIEQYIQKKEKEMLAGMKKSMIEMHNNPSLYADVHMDIRSLLVTRRIYLSLALFILLVLDFICIFQYTQLHALSILAFGSVSVLCSGILLIGLLSCNEILHKIL